jgi:hypothetical protein
MKRNRSVAKAIESAEPIPTAGLSDEKQNELRVESNLSPERLLEGVSTTTSVLNQILAEHDTPHELREWGINE